MAQQKFSTDSQKRSVKELWYTNLHLKDLGQTWQTQGNAQKEYRYFSPKLTPQFIQNIPKDKPVKIMFYRSLGGDHWVGIGVIIENGKATIAYADSLHPEHSYEYLANSKKQKDTTAKQLIDEVVSPLEQVLGQNNVTKKTYEHAWTQTNWRGNKEETPGACGVYTIENMRRFLAHSNVADTEANPGSLILRQEQLDRMQKHSSIMGASYSDTLLQVAQKFNAHKKNIRFSDKDIPELLQDSDFKEAIMFERGIETLEKATFEDTAILYRDIAATLNRYLDLATQIKEKKNNFKRTLTALQKIMSKDLFKNFIEDGCNVTDNLIQQLINNQKDPILLIEIGSTLPTLTPSQCNEVIRNNFKNIKPPFEKIENEKSSKRLAMQLQNQEQQEFQMEQDIKEKMEQADLKQAKQEQIKADELYASKLKQELDNEASTKEFIQIEKDKMLAQDEQKKEYLDILKEDLQEKLQNSIEVHTNILGTYTEQKEQLIESTVNACITALEEDSKITHEYLTNENNRNQIIKKIASEVKAPAKQYLSKNWVSHSFKNEAQKIAQDIVNNINNKWQNKIDKGDDKSLYL